jgi:hypothetical protein
VRCAPVRLLLLSRVWLVRPSEIGDFKLGLFSLRVWLSGCVTAGWVNSGSLVLLALDTSESTCSGF